MSTHYVANLKIKIGNGRTIAGNTIEELTEKYENLRSYILSNNVLSFEGLILDYPSNHQPDLETFLCVLDIAGKDINKACLSFGKTPITNKKIPFSICNKVLRLHLPTHGFFKESAYTPEGLFKARKITGLTKKSRLKNKIEFMEAFLLQRGINPRLNQGDYNLLDYSVEQIGNSKFMLREVLNHYNEVYITNLLRIVTSHPKNTAPF